MTGAAQEINQPVFNIEKIYVKDLSLEIPHAPEIFLERENPQIDVQLNTQTATIEGDVYEVMITNTVTAKVGEKVMFLALASGLEIGVVVLVLDELVETHGRAH